ncbi:MAG: TetR/AcrR family transcriptional regulator [bacterium]|nr:TetR/AcrR family transcriptional regulator [bacterium]
MVQIAAESSPTTLRAADRKREILAAASTVFRSKGLHATGMRDIASELGMHVGNLYYYFKNKEELLAFCQEDALAGLRTLVKKTRTLDVGADQRLRHLIVGHVELLNETTPGSLAHLEVEALSEEWHGRIVELRDDYEHAIRQIIDEGVASGVFRDVDSDSATLAILGALNWTVKWFRRDGKKSAAEIGSEFADLLVGGLMLPCSAGSPGPPGPETQRDECPSH